MSSYSDNILRMGFIFFPEGNVLFEDLSAMSSWKLVANSIVKSPVFNDQLEKLIPGTEKFIDTALTYLRLDDRIKYLYRVVKKRIPNTEIQGAFPEDAADTWKKRSGSSAEINMLLANLLKRSHITCHPVLVSTRENGKINTDMPNFGQFNGMDILVIADGQTYLLDASLKFQSYNTPPANILNRQAFLLDPDNIRWVMISDNSPLLKQSTDIFATLKNDGKIEGGATITYYDYAKSIFLDTSTTAMEKEEGKFFDKRIPGLKILSDKLDDPDNDGPLYQTIEFDYETQSSDNFYFINPQLFSTKKLNPFVKEKRNTDIDFGSNQEMRLSMQLDIPSSFLVETLPKSIVIRSPDTSFIYTRMISVSQSKISFLQVFEIKKPVFTKNEYAGLIDFFEQVRKVMAEEIILKKTK